MFVVDTNLHENGGEKPQTLLFLTTNMAAVTSRAGQQWSYERDWVEVVSSCSMGLFCGTNFDAVSRAISLQPIKETKASKNIPIVHLDTTPTQSYAPPGHGLY